ncbi:pejvakin-like isoform X2 [Tubulanus polymorphus]|uniref:pejvakin-like isoform X2 n=1 Tax=Tubulanus polymorphus TaxID=672921 RepID=UPI003DA65397
MFEAAVHKFVKEAGPEVLHQVPSLDEANRCRPLQIVEKKNRRWFWQTPRYRPTDFSLDQILADPKPLGLEVQSRVLVKGYNRMHKFSIKGKFGGGFKVLFDAELSGGDNVNLTAKFNDIEKKEVHEQSLSKALRTRKINMNHPLLKQILLMKRRKALCIITGSAQLSADSVITASIDNKVDEDINLDLPKVLKVDESIDEETDNSKSMTIPQGTPIAYNLVELKIASDGVIKLVVDDDVVGGFVESAIDAVDAPISCPEVYDMFKKIMDMKDAKRLDIRNAILRLCKSPNDVDSLLRLFKNVYRAKRDGKPMNCDIEEVNSIFFGDPDDKSWKFMLQISGFIFKSDKLQYPSNLDSMMSSICSLLEALAELDDDSTIALSKLGDENPQFAKPLFHLLKECLTTRGNEAWTGLHPIADSVLHFLQRLGFLRTDDIFTPPVAGFHELEGASRVIYALWCRKTDA